MHESKLKLRIQEMILEKLFPLLQELRLRSEILENVNDLVNIARQMKGAKPELEKIDRILLPVRPRLAPKKDPNAAQVAALREAIVGAIEECEQGLEGLLSLMKSPTFSEVIALAQVVKNLNKEISSIK